MNDPRLIRTPIAQTGMLIRQPAADTYVAFVDPDITTKFWFTKSSGRLAVDAKVKWEWEMYGASTDVVVKALEPDRRILIEWDGYSGRTLVEWTFTALKDGTFVRVRESGWTGTGDELVKYVTDSSEGFALTLAGLKAFLEHHVQLNLVRDRFPSGIEKD